MTTPARKKAAKLAELQARDDLVSLLAVPAFCRVVHTWLARSGLWHSSFRGEQPLAMAFNEGTRNLGLSIAAELESADAGALARLKAHAVTLPPSDTESPDE